MENGLVDLPPDPKSAFFPVRVPLDEFSEILEKMYETANNNKVEAPGCLTYRQALASVRRLDAESRLC